MVKYFKESFKELSRVSWPNFNSTVRLTIVVLLFAIISAALIGTVDYILNAGYKQVVDYTIESGIRLDQRTTNSDSTSGDDVNINLGNVDATLQLQDGETVETSSDESASPAASFSIRGEGATDEAATEVSADVESN